MNYIEMINQFWKIRRSKKITPTQAYLYFGLLQECNEREWESPFEYPNESICSRIGVSEPTMIDARARLKQLGLIDFESGERNKKSPRYYLNNLSRNRAETEQKPSRNRAESITFNTKQNINNNNSNELFPPEPPKKPPKRAKKEFIPPRLEEVKAYFADQLPNWEQEAEIFFNHFDSLGWRTATGGKVEKWDSRANLWITEKLIANGKNRESNPSTRGESAGINSITF